ncbi:MAG: radical SAM family heme chaperone HemW [Clostridia bacterium]|nr:radical SAM family heme chaperone HemW [Clostridia bacterium]
MSTLGLYLHIPFCQSKCRYCDFCSFPGRSAEAVDAYCIALLREIEAYGEQMRGIAVDTVYFGGGTPTYLPKERLAALVESVTKHFSVNADAEITTECNPATVDLPELQALRAAGFNRLIIGAQSLSDRELRLLGRIHTAADFKATFEAARRAGFDNLSADVMFGIPAQTAASFAATLRGLCELAPDHISAYGLKIEEGTPFFAARDTLPLPDEDTERQMYMDAVTLLAEHGYDRYEISNFAKKGRESRHNLRYWERMDYLGMGLAAYSCLGNERFSNTEDMARYLAGDRLAEHEHVSAHDALCEAVMLGMRLERGVDFTALAGVYGDAAYEYQSRLSKYQDGGFVRQTERGLAFTSDGMYVSNAILSDILDFEN